MEILASPDLLTPSHSGRQNAWKRTERGWVSVTFVDEGSTRVVITVTPRHRGPRES